MDWFLPCQANEGALLACSVMISVGGSKASRNTVGVSASAATLVGVSAAFLVLLRLLIDVEKVVTVLCQHWHSKDSRIALWPSIHLCTHPLNAT